MKTAEEWAGSIRTYGGRPQWLIRQFRVAQDEAAEAMRQTLVNLVGDSLQASAQLVKDMLAVPLPGEVVGACED